MTAWVQMRMLHLVCLYIGHTPSWVDAVGIGLTDRPICRRCGRDYVKQP